MHLGQLHRYLDNLLSISRIKDSSHNGIQVGRQDKDIKKIALAVDANLSTVKAAALREADLLLVHHGIYWGKSFPLTGGDYEKMSTFVQADLPLYAVHLPLDLHAPLGNNYQLANLMKLADIEPFGDYYGVPIGYSGTCSLDLTTLEEELSKLSDTVCFHLNQPEKIRRVAVVSGKAGSDILEQFKNSGLDLFITGELEHALYNTIQDHGLNVISLGHYESEKFGVLALGVHLERELGLETFFIHEPTGY